MKKRKDFKMLKHVSETFHETKRILKSFPFSFLYLSLYNQTPNKKSKRNCFMKRKLFPKRFRKYNQTTNKKSIPNCFMKRKLFRKSFRKYNQTTNEKSIPNCFMKRKLFRKSFRKWVYLISHLFFCLIMIRSKLLTF